VNELHFNALVLETTDRCNARCAMCYQASGPKGSDIRGDERLPLDTILRVIEEAANIDAVKSRLHVSGGEAFLYFDETVQAFRRAREVGYANIGSTTNAFWAVTRDVALRRCSELQEAGVDYLEASFDIWHLPYIAPMRIKNLLWAARRVGLTIILRTLTTRSHHIDELLAQFTDEDLVGCVIANGRAHPVGRGATDIPEEEIYYGNGPVGNCQEFLALTIAPNGNVYPCCAGADMTESLASGNVNRESLHSALFKMRTDRTIRHVIHAGAGSLVPIIEELGYGHKLRSQYTSICHLCWDVFKDDELASALRTHFADEQVREMTAVLEAAFAAAQSGEAASQLLKAAVEPRS
jgi:MoaA/NifB/PqqE/SkfB family radical SAM enzyme